MNGGEILIDLSHEQFGREIPFQAFAELRRRSPLFWYERDQYWVVSTYELLGEINRNPGVFSSWGGPTGAGSTLTPGSQPLGNRMLIQMDPPEHTVHRRLVSSSFTPRAVNARAETVRSLSRELVDAFVSKGGGGLGRGCGEASALAYHVRPPGHRKGGRGEHPASGGRPGDGHRNRTGE